MKALKKYFAMLASAGFVMAVAATSHAAFTSHGIKTLSATSGLTGGTATVQINAVTLKTIGTNTALGAGSPMTWTNPTPGAGFLVADQYIQLDTTINTLNGGVQIYTDNHNAAATPRYTGLISSYTATPAGLVMVNDTTQKLPTAWRASTYTLTGVTGWTPTPKPASPTSGSSMRMRVKWRSGPRAPRLSEWSRRARMPVRVPQAAAIRT